MAMPVGLEGIDRADPHGGEDAQTIDLCSSEAAPTEISKSQGGSLTDYAIFDSQYNRNASLV
jgi:hypothetical protein